MWPLFGVEIDKDYLHFIIGILFPVTPEMSSHRNGFCAPTCQQLNQLVGCRLCFFFPNYDFVLLLFNARLLDRYRALHMFFAKNLPLHKSRNYSSASASFSIIIFFIVRFTDLGIVMKVSIPVPVLQRWGISSQLVGHPVN